MNLVPIAAAASLFLTADVQAAATLTIGSSVSSGNVIATSIVGTETGSNVNQLYISSDYVAGDNGSGPQLHMLGQSFTTGILGANNILETIGVQATTGGASNYGGTLTINLFEVTNTGVAAFGGFLGAGNLLESWTASSGLAGGNASSNGEWIVFNLSASNRTLADNKIYAFTFSGAGTGSDNSKIFFEWNGTSTNPYSGGQAMSQDVADQPSGSLWFGSGAATTGDRVFQVTTVPEPSAAVLVGLGVLALLRRRRA